ncbi:SGNH/GDSL hydrolase family protein [Nonomuraea sp. B5E05]|uniref:SGNH/GDSL hydrolase family protein n=1 Tax=Nonomuraea sp. B5E05 TaxID=3153569 RepID=UPI00326002C8
MNVPAKRLALFAAALAVVLSTGTAHADRAPEWSGAWSASPQAPSTGFAPNWSEQGFDGETIRQVVRVSAGGSAVRVRLSNEYGKAPLKVAGATIARTVKGADVKDVRPLTFGGKPSTTIAAGRRVATDAARLRVKPFESVAVTLYLSGRTGPATFHAQGYATTYRADGDHRADRDGAAFMDTTVSWYYLTDVEVDGGPPARNAVVTLGDSITDGFGSTTDANNRFSDELAEHLKRPVLNQGIGGNRVLTDSAWYGERALDRLRRDVLSKPDVGTLFVLEGINDIGFSDWAGEATAVPRTRVSAAQLIEGHRALIERAHAKGIKVVGATLLPYKGSQYFTARGERVRDALNTWIRTSGAYDAVVDFDKIMADPADPDQINPAYDSGDKLHPGDAGYRVMAEAVDPCILG